MSRPLVTAIVPTYQRAAELHRSIRSVLAQDYRPLELVVVDDGSGDGTQEVLAAFKEDAERASVAYRYYEKENGGAGAARNFAMEHAEGEIFAFLDDDDRWLPEKLSRQVAAMQAHPEAGASFTRYIHEGRADRPKPKLTQIKDGWVFATLCTGETRAHLQTLAIRREWYDKVGGFGNERNWQDTEWTLRLALETRFTSIPDALTEIRTVENSISREAGLEGDLKRDEMKLRQVDGIEGQFRDHPRYDAEAIKVLRARLYDEHIKHLLWLGRVKDARAAWNTAVSECGKVDFLMKLRRKLFRATVAGWFGRKLTKPE